MLRIHIASIAETGWQTEEQVDALLLPLIADAVHDGSAAFTHPVKARLRAALEGETVRIDGWVQSMVRLNCSRCLRPFEWAIKTKFSVTAMPEFPEVNTDRLAEDVELSPDEMNVITYVGDSIDLREEIAQQILLALPYKPLCSEGCKGLCSRCGVDLNTHSCQCDNQNQGSPFAILKTLTLPTKKD